MTVSPKRSERRTQELPRPENKKPEALFPVYDRGMTVSSTRRLKVAQIAAAYRATGGTQMANIFLASVESGKRSPAETARIMEQARNRIREIIQAANRQHRRPH